MNSSENTEINPKLKSYINGLDLNNIPQERKEKLNEMAGYFSSLLSAGKDIDIIFICTHNSRRSHIAQLWAWVAASYYNIPNVNTYSGGTEATAFNTRSVEAMQKAGIKISTIEESTNPVYECSYSETREKIKVYSKFFGDKTNPQENFTAVMVCSDADEACPYVAGASKRYSLPYKDPKKYDNTGLEAQKYDERTAQIASEIFYMFSKIKVH